MVTPMTTFTTDQLDQLDPDWQARIFADANDPDDLDLFEDGALETLERLSRIRRAVVGTQARTSAVWVAEIQRLTEELDAAVFDTDVQLERLDAEISNTIQALRSTGNTTKTFQFPHGTISCRSSTKVEVQAGLDVTSLPDEWQRAKPAVYEVDKNAVKKGGVSNIEMNADGWLFNAKTNEDLGVRLYESESITWKAPQ